MKVESNDPEKEKIWQIDGLKLKQETQFEMYRRMHQEVRLVTVVWVGSWVKMEVVGLPEKQEMMSGDSK